MAEQIFALLENLIYDIAGSTLKNLFDKRRFYKFLRSLKADIIELCQARDNESIYIDSSAFDFFLRSTDFLKRVIERSISTKLEKSNKEFLRDEIKRAREIAVGEGVSFSNSDERVIKDLYHLIADSVGTYYCKKLSVEQRRTVSICLNQIMELKEAVHTNHKEDHLEHREILNAIKEEGKLNNTKASLVADLLSKDLFEGRLQDFDDLAVAVKDKSDDLELFYECLSQIMRLERCTDAVKRINEITDSRIRDNAVRTALPILLFRKEPIDELVGATTAGSLSVIVDCLINGKNDGIFTEEVSLDDGLEIHNLSFNRKLIYEEESLVEFIVILSLYDRRFKNIHRTMEKIGKGKRTWLTEILIADKRVENLASENEGDKTQKFESIINQVQQYKSTFDGLCKTIRSIYYSVIVKAYLIMDNVVEAEKSVPEDLKQERPLSDYVYAIRNAKRDVDLNEVFDYSVHNEKYWLLNHYFVSRKDEKELLDFCREHEDIFEKDWKLFFMYQGVLNDLGYTEEREKQLKKHADELRSVYEYWDEILNISDSEENHKAFVEACRDGKMKSLIPGSEYLIIERLLYFHEYDLAELYITKHEKVGDNGFKIKKYKAITLQGKNNDVEALKWYRAAFDDNRSDVFVIDSLISLSLINKRKVNQEVIDSAIRADTSRLHMLAAACYMNERNVSKAKSENIRAILLSGNDYNPAFGQYIAISISTQSSEVPKILGIEADTAACCKKNDGTIRWLCVYKDCLLPISPYYWNNDFHVHYDDAARMGFLRRRIGDHVTIDNDAYVITEIVLLDCYLFKICATKMMQNGFAKKLAIPVRDGKMDVSAFTEMIAQIAPDKGQCKNWLEQYNNIQDVPLPLYTYKRFTRLTYFQFVDFILSSRDYFVRQLIYSSRPSKKYVITFSALVALYKAGYPVERIIEVGGVIMESVVVQAGSDVAEIIDEYDRDTVASLGVVDGKVYYDEVDDVSKDYWIKEAGGFKKYCESIPVKKSDQDLSGDFFGSFDSKEIFGICDYDAISFVINNEGYSLVTIEAILASLAQNELVKLKVISVSDWLVEQKIGAEKFIEYLKALIEEGCLQSLTKEVIKYISADILQNDDDYKRRVYSAWNDLLIGIDKFPDKQKAVFIQAVSEVFTSFQDEVRDIDKGIIHILTRDILLLKKQRVEVFYDKEDRVSFALVNIEPEDNRSI